MTTRRFEAVSASFQFILRGLLLRGVPVLALTAAPALAQEQRPSEADIFGGSQAPKPPAEGAPPAATAPEQAAPAAQAPEDRPTPPPSTPESSRDEAILGAESSTSLSTEAAPEDPLRIGGLFYLRAQTAALQGQAPDDWTFSTPSLLDAYMDARPNERVRGFLLARMQYDPTLPVETATGADLNMGQLGPGETAGATMGTADLSSLFRRQTRGPRVVLDQLWLRIDVKQRVFVTAGKQHVRWGTARFWTPTDFLHIRRRNPLDVFDARVGTNMLKLHVPWEARGWNFYAYGITEDTDSTPTVGDVAGAARAEVVLGTTEIGLGGVVQSGRKPKLAVDASTAIWDFDVYGELGVRYGSEIDRVRFDEGIDIPTSGGFERLPSLIEDLYPANRQRGLKPQVVGGLSYSRQYADKDVWTVGAEYFYNTLGYDSPEVYPGLVLPRTSTLREPATFFYLGRHYGALFFSLPAPYSWDYTTFTLSTLGNLSDQSFITRLDYSLLMLTHLRFEAFVAVHYGRREGEFRFGTKGLMFGGIDFSRSPALLDLGVALRVSL